MLELPVLYFCTSHMHIFKCQSFSFPILSTYGLHTDSTLTNPPYADANYHCMVERLSQIAEKWGFWSLIPGIMKRLTVFPLLSNHYSTEYKKQRTGGTT